MGFRSKIISDESGSVLVISLVILLLLTILGISVSKTSQIEIKIAGNEKFHKMAFYACDGGTEAGAELLERNIEERGFTTVPWTDVTVSNMNFWTNLIPSDPSDANRDVLISNVVNGHINLKYDGDSELSTGGAIQLVAGYEGKGKGSGASGAYLIHNIRSHAVGVANAEARVCAGWRHVL